MNKYYVHKKVKWKKTCTFKLNGRNAHTGLEGIKQKFFPLKKNALLHKANYSVK